MTCIYHKHRDQTDKIDLVDRLTTGTMHANIQASNEGQRPQGWSKIPLSQFIRKDLYEQFCP